MKTSMKNYFVRLFTALLFLTTANAFAQVNVAGKPVRLGNLEVAQFDFPNAMNWWDARDACETLTGGGWRLPTEIELNTFFLNRLKI
jgi:hypothetical protein